MSEVHKVAIIGSRSGTLDAVDEQRVEVRNIVFENGGSEGGADALGLDQIFVGDRESVQNASKTALCGSFVEFFGALQGLLGNEGDDRVDLGIDALNLLQVRFENFSGGDLFLAQFGRQIACGYPIQ